MSESASVKDPSGEKPAVKRVDDQTTIPNEPSSVEVVEPTLFLSVCSEKGPSECVALNCKRPLVVGRNAGGVQLDVQDARISRLHFRVSYDGRSRAYRIDDQHTRNGTFLNGQRIESSALRDGDVVRAGDSLFVCHAARKELELDRLVRARTVFIGGDTGVGKGLLARRIHEASGRAPFVPVNCGALPKELVAAELFGHARGAFSGATVARGGLFAQAHGGTLFLDEICELPLEVQPVLLQVLDDFEVRPVGSDVSRRVDVRVIAASNADVHERVAAGAFRSDLLARLSMEVVTLPSLCAERERILVILGEILRNSSGPKLWSADAREALLLWDWPYNVREMQALVERLTGAVPEGQLVSVADIARVCPDVTAHLERCRTGSAPHTEAREPNRAELERLLGQYGGNVSAVAQELGKPRASLYRMLQRFGLTTRGGASGG